MGACRVHSAQWVLGLIANSCRTRPSIGILWKLLNHCLNSRGFDKRNQPKFPQRCTRISSKRESGYLESHRAGNQGIAVQGTNDAPNNAPDHATNPSFHDSGGEQTAIIGSQDLTETRKDTKTTQYMVSADLPIWKVRLQAAYRQRSPANCATSTLSIHSILNIFQHGTGLRSQRICKNARPHK